MGKGVWKGGMGVLGGEGVGYVGRVWGAKLGTGSDEALNASSLQFLCQR